MIIIWGTFGFARKRIAYRNDYCLHCERENLAEEYRSFDLFSLFFIPIMPLGHRMRWQCHRCGADPHHRTRTSKTLIVLFAVVIGLVAVLTWLIPAGSKDDASTVWTMRSVFLLGFLAILYGIKRMKPAGPGLDERLREVLPYRPDQCIYCEGALDPSGYCAACEVRHLPRNAPRVVMPLPS